jgi:teichuronic acid exporter
MDILNNKEVKETALFGLAWKTLETILVNGTQTLIFLVLARLLTPADFGVVALVGAFIGISGVFVNSGLGTALIQTKQVNETDYCTVLYFSIFIACVLYLFLFLAAGSIAGFYKEPIMEIVLKFYAISIIISAINGVQKSILMREMEFKKIFLVSSISVIFSGAISIWMAFLGFGVFALVVNSIFLGVSSTAAFFIVMKWRPKLVFSMDRLRELFGYSYKLLLSNLIEVGYINIFPLLIGKSFSSAALGYYNNGKQIPSLISSNINASITSVTFTIYSRYQSDLDKLKSIVRQSIIVSNLLILPIMALLAGTAESLVILILTEKWLPSVPYIQLFCVVYGLHHQHNINFQAISAIGRSDVFLKYQLIKKVIGISLLMFTLQFSLAVIIMGQILTAVISVIVSTRPNRMLLNYSVSEQLMDFVPYLLISIVMYVTVYAVSFLEYGVLATLLLQVLLGMVVYIALAFCFKLKGLEYVLELIKPYLARAFTFSR